MKSKHAFLLITLAGMIVLMISSCKKELLDPVCDGSTPTWDSDIGDIITTNCSGSTCHSSGSSRGDFQSYDGIKPVLDNGRFEEMVLTTQAMPKGSKDLTQGQLNLIQCWLENGFPEN